VDKLLHRRQVVAKKNTQVATDFTSERAYNKHARKGERGRGREREREGEGEKGREREKE